ncbi:tyrosine recombinase XerC [Caldicellulosiruptoraceae bacterium PP1]
MDFNDVPSYVKEFLNYMLTIKNKSFNTVKEYHYDLRTFLRYLKAKNEGSLNCISNHEDLNKFDVSDFDIEEIRKINLSDLYEYFTFITIKLRNSSYARSRKVASIKAFFNYLFSKTKLIPNNPAKELESPKIGLRQPKHLTLEQSLNLLQVIDGDNKERDYAIITLFLNCGLRLSELININITDIQEDKLRVIGKGNKERTIYLNKACIDAINTYLNVRPKEGVKDRYALFLSERKTRISRRTVQYIVKKYVQLSNIDSKKISPHKLRHTAATLMYKYGNVDIRALQQILGHQSVATTEIYTHIDDEQLRNAIKKNPLSGE